MHRVYRMMRKSMVFMNDYGRTLLQSNDVNRSLYGFGYSWFFFVSWLRAPSIIHEYVRVMRRRKDKCVDLIQFRAIWRVFMNQLERRTTSLAVVTSHCLIDYFFLYRLWMPCVTNQLRVLLFRKFSCFRTDIDLNENCLTWVEQCWSWHARANREWIHKIACRITGDLWLENSASRRVDRQLIQIVKM